MSKSDFKEKNWDMWLKIFNGHNLNSFKYLIGRYIMFRSKYPSVITISVMRDMCLNHGFGPELFDNLLGRCKFFMDKSELKDGVIQLSPLTEKNLMNFNELEKNLMNFNELKKNLKESKRIPPTVEEWDYRKNTFTEIDRLLARNK